MKILYLTMRYSFDDDGLYQNLVDSLIERGHIVTIVRSVINGKKNNIENINDNLSVLSIKTGNPFDSNLIKKGINQILLARYFKKGIKKELSRNKYDLIIYSTPPVTLANVVKYCKNKFHAKTYLMLKDIFPQNAVDLEMMRKNSLIYRYFRKQEKVYYKISDYIGCMSQGNVTYLINHDPEIDPNKVSIFPNSIRVSEVEELSFHEDKTLFMFGGNLGKPQNIDGLLDIIKSLSRYKKANFCIVGSGVEQSKIENFIKSESPQNLMFKHKLPQVEYEELLKSADVGLISLDSRFTIPNVPSRFQVYLKLKKPVFAFTDNQTDLRDMIRDNDCGWWCCAEDKEKIIETIKYICEHKEEQKQKGLNGFEYLKSAFDVEKNVDVLEKVFKS